MQALQSFFAVLGQLWLSNGRCGTGKEPRLPLGTAFLALSCLFSLLLFYDLLDGGGERELFIYDRICDFRPESAGFVGELLFSGWHNLRNREEGLEVNQKYFLLRAVRLVDVVDPF